MSGSGRRVLLLAGPSGSGKSHMARASGLPVLPLDDFYKDGDDPTLPRSADLGIVDWDDPAAWDADRAVAALDELVRTGRTELPVYDIAADRATTTREFRLDRDGVVVAEGLFAGELVGALGARGLPADALVLRRRPWKNFLRRLARDLAERRKPPLVLLRRGRLLLAAEEALVRRQVALGCRPVTASGLRRALRAYAAGRADASPAER